MLLRELLFRDTNTNALLVLQVCIQLAVSCISVRKKLVECHSLLLSYPRIQYGAHRAPAFKVR